MSSVGKSDENRYAYQMQAAQKEKAQQDKIKNLQASHAEDIGRVKEESQNTLDQMRERYQTKLSEQEQRHLDEIEKLKEMYQKKLAEREA